MDGFGIQVSIKTPGDSLINIRGESPEEFDQHLSHVVEKMDEIKAAETAFKTPALTGLALIERELGGQVVEEYNTPPAGAWPHPGSPPPAWQAPPQPAYPPAPQQGYQQTLCGRCGQAPACKGCGGPCNPVPKSVKGGEYYIHECPQGANGDRSHKGQWCNAK